MRQYIHYISPSYEGSIHDYGLLKALFPPAEGWLAGYKVRVDVGFKRLDKDYAYKAVYIPHKRSKNKELTKTQKSENQQLDSE